MWEYKLIVSRGEISEKNQNKLNEQLNKLGQEGWELVNIIPQISSDMDFATGDVDIDISCCRDVYVGKNVFVFKKKYNANED